jgi:NIMA (never in mitosis gene a)-related kinase
LKEAKILEVVSKHPNIVGFKEVYKTKQGKLCIVMEYIDGGDLNLKVAERTLKNDYIIEEQILNWFTQVCLALKHCHDRKIIHRDLKTKNIFITKKGICKLGDFGIARVLSNTVSQAKTVVGTPYYLSPEIIEGKGYSFESDIWSLGVLLFELCALHPPFTGTSLHVLAKSIINDPIP